MESSSLVHENLPEACKKTPCIIGIDEAGRGPVLGPLVYALFVCPEASTSMLKDLGAGDSKEKSLDQRDRFYEQLQGVKSELGWKAHVLHPEHISNCMLQKEKYNLNTLSHDTVYGLIRSVLDQGITITHGYVDTLGPAEKYKANLESRFPGILFTVKSKADSLFPVVGAASIVAKVIRDRTLNMWMAEKGSSADFGCGYPSDPSTVAWLKGNVDPVFGYSDIVRFSWSSCERILNEKAVKVTWPDHEKACDRPSPKTMAAFCGLKSTNFSQ